MRKFMKDPLVVYFKNERDGHRFSVPIQKTVGSAGFDLTACLDEKVELRQSGVMAVVSLGFSMELPEGYEAQLRPRSGLALKYGVTVANSPATIDSDFRGVLKVLLVRVADAVIGEDGSLKLLPPCVISDGDRICQMVIAKTPSVTMALKEELTDTERGSGGFGSTGGFGGITGGENA